MENDSAANDKMLDVDEGPTAPEEQKISADEAKKIEIAKKMVKAEKLYEVMKALTAMKLTKEDSMPGAVFPDLLLGSIGCAYNKEVLNQIGITHILTCAAKIKPRFEGVS